MKGIFLEILGIIVLLNTYSDLVAQGFQVVGTKITGPDGEYWLTNGTNYNYKI